MRNPIVRGGQATFAAATIAVDTSATEPRLPSSLSVRDLALRRQIEFGMAAMSRRGRASICLLSYASRESVRARIAFRRGNDVHRRLDLMYLGLPALRATASATSPHTSAIIWELALCSSDALQNEPLCRNHKSRIDAMDDIRAGRLTRILEDWCPPLPAISLPLRPAADAASGGCTNCRAPFSRLQVLGAGSPDQMVPSDRNPL